MGNGSGEEDVVEDNAAVGDGDDDGACSQVLINSRKFHSRRSNKIKSEPFNQLNHRAGGRRKDKPDLSWRQLLQGPIAAPRA